MNWYNKQSIYSPNFLCYIQIYFCNKKKYITNIKIKNKSPSGLYLKVLNFIKEHPSVTQVHLNLSIKQSLKKEKMHICTKKNPMCMKKYPCVSELVSNKNVYFTKKYTFVSTNIKTRRHSPVDNKPSLNISIVKKIKYVTWYTLQVTHDTGQD